MSVGVSGVEGATESLANALFDSADVLAGIFELHEADYSYVVANKNTAAFYGRTPDQMVGLTGKSLGLAPDQIARRMENLRRCWAEKRPTTAEYPFSHGASSGWFLGSFAPVPGDRPQVSFILVDITARKTAQLEAERERGRLAIALDATGLGLWEYDIPADVVIWDARMRALFGVSPDTVIDFAVYQSRLHPEDAPGLFVAYQAALRGEGGGRYTVEHRTAPDAEGRSRWIRGTGQVLFDDQGAPVQVLGTAIDITAEVEARERQRLLMAELNHRVKNNLATVQSVAMLTSRESDSLESFLKIFEGRITALARTHDVLTASSWSAAQLGDVARRELDRLGDRIVIDGPDVGLNAQQSLAVGLILHELATNAAKYGALSTPHGRIALGWTREADGEVRLRWTESDGPRHAGGLTYGFGTRLIEKLSAGDLGGRSTLDLPPQGLRFEVRFRPA